MNNGELYQAINCLKNDHFPGFTQIMSRFPTPNMPIPPDFKDIPPPLRNFASMADAAAYFGAQNCLTYILSISQNCNNLDKKNRSLLHFACYYGKLETVQLVYELGFPVDAKTSSGNTVFHIAAKRNYLQIIKYLFSVGGNLNAANKARILPIHYSIAYGFNDITDFIYSATGITNQEVYQGGQLIYLGFKKSNEELLSKLLEDHYNDYIESANCYPIHYAIKSKNIQLATNLINKGIDIDVKNKQGDTPLMLAVSIRSLDLINLLLDNGADINAQNNKGWSALHIAINKSFNEIVELLLNEEECDIDLISKDGFTALDMAKIKKKTDIIQIFEDFELDYNEMEQEDPYKLHNYSKKESQDDKSPNMYFAQKWQKTSYNGHKLH